ncbi:MAG TPA: hypothetical protein VK947_02140 [Planococcus sp. (in: firmicutes)]|nr:hypothetical protein [Planococcus sp. (in: firmicutes)]
MKKLTALTSSALLAMSLAACGDSPEYQMVQEREADEAEGIETNEEIEGVFRGYEDDDTAVVIEYGGDEIKYPIVEGATGDFDSVEEGDSIVFTTRNVTGTDMVETLEVVE